MDDGASTYGRVLGLDLAEPALARARAKAAEQGLANVEFRAEGVREVETNVVYGLAHKPRR